MKVEEYSKILHDDIERDSIANFCSESESFLSEMKNILIDEDEEFYDCYWKGISTKQHKAIMQLDGYSLDNLDDKSYICSIYIVDYRGIDNKDNTIRKDYIEKLFGYIKHFVIESVTYKLHKDLEFTTQEYEFSKFLYDNINNITKFKFNIITDAYNKQMTKNIQNDSFGGKEIELHVWDINRICDIVNSNSQKESIDIDLSKFNSKGIPCVKAVEYQNAIMDIDTLSNKKEDDNKISYESYLAVVPGTLLNSLYLEYGSRLLEGNVRSFLSAKGKVNKNIQFTIKNYPEMFFAYNNGIAATATHVETDSKNGLKITRIRDLQIVNGGQTTASITNSILTKKENESIYLDKIFVPMKISVLEHSMSEKIIPKISEYSNSQNKIDASDFFSNHPFHVRMEDFSRKTPAPAINGNQYQQYWYYERARGQYNQGKMKFKPKSKEIRNYEMKYPKNQIIKMVDLCKYMEIYLCKPHIVSKGKQALVKDFAPRIKEKWDNKNNDTIFNRYYFKKVVALAIIFNKTDELIKNIDWYKEKHSYKANVIAYTMSIIFNHINEHKKGYELNFIRIWEKQDIQSQLKKQLSILITEVYKFITSDDREKENVTEWCKREKCWENAKGKNWTFIDDFDDLLIKEEEVAYEKKEAKEECVVQNDINNTEDIMSKTTSYWKKVYEWGIEHKCLSDIDCTVLEKAISRKNFFSYAKAIKKLRERLIKTNGMPYDF